MLRTRYLLPVIQELAFNFDKMAFVSGPRQTGKTILSQMLLKKRSAGKYFNWDDKDFRKAWTQSPRGSVQDILASPVGKRPLAVIDEIHKAKKWKQDLKGIFDHHKGKLDILVTGSARLNIYKKGGESLLGRYFHFVLHPFSVREALGFDALSPEKSLEGLYSTTAAGKNAAVAFEELFKFGGFPEPFLRKMPRFHRLWQHSRLEKLVREDLRDLSRIPELSQVEMLMALLPDRVGQPLSVQSLREDLEVAHTSVSRWLRYLEVLYYCYLVRPYSRSVSRSIKKEPKLYLWDWSEVSEPGARFENLVAGHLSKACDFWRETGEGDFDLNYLRNKEKEEVDFLVTKDRRPWLAVECKNSDTNVQASMFKFLKQLGLRRGLQLVRQPCEPRRVVDPGTKTEILVRSAVDALVWLV